MKSVDQIGATRAQLVNNTSPLVTIVLAALLLGGRLTATVLAGVILIVSGIFFIPKAEVEASRAPAKRMLTLASILATICYGLVPVMKKICDRQRWLPHARRFDHTCDRLGAVA